MVLSPDRLDRFARQIILPEIGGAGQVALTKAHVALVGLGGIGSPVLQYLAGAGVGRLTLIDDDKVSASNLQRQTLYGEGGVGAPKSAKAAAWLRDFDRDIAVDTFDEHIDETSAARAFGGADLVLDGTDNFATRLAVSDACVAERIPLLSAAVARFQGQVAAFAGHRGDQPCYRCYVGDAFDADDCDTCAENGILGAMAGWTGTFAAMQAVRVLTQGHASFGDPQWGQLHILDGMQPGMKTIRIVKDPDCKTCSPR